MSSVEFKPEKLFDCIRVILDLCEPHELGQVKLHKVLYYSDMLMYLWTGNAITGSTYRKRPLGPTCEPLLRTLATLESSGEIQIDEIDYFGHKKKHFHKVRRINGSSLSEAEVAALSEVVDFVCRKHTASTISEFSHDIVWDSVEFGQHIPYHLALAWVPSNESESVSEWADKVVSGFVDSGWQAEHQTLEGPARGTLRERMAIRA
jgi:hypothetical protein